MEHSQGMVDLGTKGNTGVEVSTKPENKIHYPSATVDKDIGMKMGQKVMLEGIVSGLRNDKYGSSTSFELHGCKPMGEKSKEPDKDWDPKDIMKYRREKAKA